MGDRDMTQSGVLGRAAGTNPTLVVTDLRGLTASVDVRRRNAMIPTADSAATAAMSADR